MTSENVVVRCVVTGVERTVKLTVKGKPRPPRGWKRMGDDYYSPDGWGSLYRMRIIQVPIAGMVDGGKWADFRAACRSAWAEGSRLANWLLREYYVRDVRREPDGPEKLASWKQPYLYPEARRLFPTLDSSIVVAIIHAVEGKYRECRYGVIWTNSEQLPCITHGRYPVPVPPSFRFERTEGGAMHATFTLGATRWVVRLQGGAKTRRAMAAIQRAIAGEHIPVEVSLYRKRETGANGHRPAITIDGAGEAAFARTRDVVVGHLSSS